MPAKMQLNNAQDQDLLRKKNDKAKAEIEDLNEQKASLGRSICKSPQIICKRKTSAVTHLHRDKRVECPECHKTYCDKNALKNHFDAIHLKIPHACPEKGCGKIFSFRRSRYRHFQTQHLEKKKVGSAIDLLNNGNQISSNGTDSNNYYYQNINDANRFYEREETIVKNKRKNYYPIRLIRKDPK